MHRNPGKTATTHVKSTAGLWRVHDGNKALPDGSSETVVDPATGKALDNLSYDDARRMKDYAVTKLKLRLAGIASMTPAPAASSAPKRAAVKPTGKIPVLAKAATKIAASPALSGPFAGEGNPSDTGLELDLPEVPPIAESKPPPRPIVLTPSDTPNPDPQLEGFRQAAMKAARPAALEAQQRADKIKRERDNLRALGIDPDNPKRGAFLPKDPNHPKTPIVGLDDINALPTEDTNADGGEDIEDVKATGAAAQRDDAERARLQAQADEVAAEGKGRLLFQKETGTPAASLSAAWNKLTQEARADYRWRAINESDVRVGDLVVYYTTPTEEDVLAAELELGEPVDLKIMMNMAQVVRVNSRDDINLQLGADRATKTADGPMVLGAKRLPESAADPLPGTWLPATAARGFDGAVVDLLATPATETA